HRHAGLPHHVDLLARGRDRDAQEVAIELGGIVRLHERLGERARLLVVQLGVASDGNSGRIDRVGQLLLGEREPAYVQGAAYGDEQRQQGDGDLDEDSAALVGAEAKQERNRSTQHDALTPRASGWTARWRACIQWTGS